MIIVIFTKLIPVGTLVYAEVNSIDLGVVILVLSQIASAGPKCYHFCPSETAVECSLHRPHAKQPQDVKKPL